MRLGSSDGNPVAPDDFLSHEVDKQREQEQHEPDHEESPVVDVTPHDFAHFLGDDPSHRMHRLNKGSETIAEIRNGDAITRAKKDDHRLADDAAKSEQHCRNDSGERSWHHNAHDGLHARGAQSE